jgi:hypothetical protein
VLEHAQDSTCRRSGTGEPSTGAPFAAGLAGPVTKGPTPHDSEAAVKLDGDVVAELEAVVAALELRH